jgi:hypothetical protein
MFIYSIKKVIELQRAIREVKIPRFRFTGTSIAILFTNFYWFLPVISTRFPAVKHGLHVNDKRVRVLPVYYLWAVSTVKNFNMLLK